MKLTDVTNFIRTKHAHLPAQDFKKLIDLLENMAKNEEKHLNDIKNRADHQFRSGSYEVAHDLYTQYIEAYGSDLIVLSNRAATSFKLGKFEDSIRDCDTALEISPDFSKLYLRKGIAYLSMGEVEKAIQCFEEGLTVDPDNSVMKNQLELARKQIDPETNEEKTGIKDVNELLEKACSIASKNGLSDIDGISSNEELGNFVKCFLAEKTPEEKIEFLNDVYNRISNK